MLKQEKDGMNTLREKYIPHTNTSMLTYNCGNFTYSFDASKQKVKLSNSQQSFIFFFFWFYIFYYYYLILLLSLIICILKYKTLSFLL